MVSSTTTYLEEQILEALDRVFGIAAELRLGGSSNYSIGDLVAATVTAILLVRAYGMYGYLDTKTCSELEEVLRSFLKAYLAPGKPEAEKALENLLTVLSSVAEHSLERRRAQVVSYGETSL